MNILTVSDTHIGRDVSYDGKLCHVGSKFQSLIDRVKEHIPYVDVITHLGDVIADDPYKDKETDLINYRKYLESISTFDKSQIVVIGNHDGKNIPRHELAKLNGHNSTYYSTDIGGYHHVVLDFSWDDNSKWSGEPPSISAGQVAWLRYDVKHTDLPTIVYSHYPIDDQNHDESPYFNGHPERLVIEQTRNKLRQILEESDKVLAVLNGHTHFFNQTKINGIKYITVPSLVEHVGNGNPQAEFGILTLNEKTVEYKLFTC